MQSPLTKERLESQNKFCRGRRTVSELVDSLHTSLKLEAVRVMADHERHVPLWGWNDLDYPRALSLLTNRVDVAMRVLELLHSWEKDWNFWKSRKGILIAHFDECGFGNDKQEFV